LLRDYESYYGSLFRTGAPAWAAARQALRELGSVLREDGVAATLLLLPEMHEPRGFGPFAAAYREVAAQGRAAGFEVLDGSAAFPPGPGNAFWVSPTDAHPDGRAQALFAQTALGSRHACAASGATQPAAGGPARANTSSAIAPAAQR
jgi:hypothetical protein